MMKKLKNKPSNDQLMLFLFSLIIAILLWAYVISEVDPPRERTIRDVKVKYKNSVNLRQNGITILEPKELTVNVKLSGNKSVMDKFKQDSLVASVELYGYTEGDHTIPIVIESNTPGIEIIDFEPRNATFKLDEEISVEKEVSYESSGALLDGYILGTIELSKNHVRIDGPKSYIENVNRVLAVVDINNRSKTTVVSVPLIAVDDEGNVVEGISIKPDTIDAQVPISKTVTVPVKIVIEGTPSSDIDIRNIALDPAVVTVSGDSSVVNQVKEVLTKPIDINSIINGSVKNASLVEPEGTKIINPDQIFRITFDLDKTVTKNFQIPVSELKAENLAENLSFKTLNGIENITVSLVGNEKTINSLTAENIEIALDLNDLQQGKHKISVIVKEIDDVKVNAIEPSNIEIEIY